MFYRLGDDIYLTGISDGETPRLAGESRGQTHFVFHLEHDIVADLAATASIVTDPTERRRVLAVFVDQFNDRHGPDGEWPVAGLDAWVEHSHLARVSFPET